MMKCKSCGAEVANVGELKKHKRECLARQAQNEEALTATEALESVKVTMQEPVDEGKTVDGLMPTGFLNGAFPVYDDDLSLRHVHSITIPESVPQEPASLEAIQRMATELGIGFLIVKDSRYLVVPRRFLPDETKYLGTNNYMGIKMRGYLQDDGLVVQEKVELIR